MILIGKILKVTIYILFWSVILCLSLINLIMIWTYYKEEVISLVVMIILLCVVADKYDGR